MSTLDRSVLENKAVAELKAIAKSLDLKTSGLKKSELVEAIAGNNGAPKRAPKAANDAKPKQEPKQEKSPSQNGESAPNATQEPVKRESAPGLDGGSQQTPGVRDEGAVDDRDNRDDRQQRRRPQGRNQGMRPREKAEPREGRSRRRRRGRGGGTGGGGGGGIPHYLRDDQYDDSEVEDDPNAEVRTGILDLLPEGYGFLRTSGYLPGDKDVYVSASQVRRFRLRKGDEIDRFGSFAQGIREVPSSAEDPRGERRRDRSRSEPASIPGPDAALPGRPFDPRAAREPPPDNGADHRPGRSDRQGATRDDRQSSKGR